MYEYATQFAPMYSRIAPSDYDAVNVPLKVFTGLDLGPNAYMVEAVGLKYAIWAGYSSRLNSFGRTMSAKFAKLAKSGLIVSLDGSRVARKGEYNRNPQNTAFNLSAFNILRKASAKIGDGKTALVFNYGLLVFDTTEKIATTALADAIAKVCGVPIEIKCRRFQK